MGHGREGFRRIIRVVNIYYSRVDGLISLGRGAIGDCR